MREVNAVGVIGLGNMGRGMALSMLRAGYDVFGFDANAATTQALADQGITVARSMEELIHSCQAIVLSLPTSAIVRSVIEGESGLISFGREGLLIVDTSTGDPAVTRALNATLKNKGIRFIDAPVSGGPGGALSGELTLFIGGSTDDVEYATPILSALGQRRFHIGDSGAGNIAKIINNLLTAAQLLTAAEAFRLGEAAGVSTEQLLDSINAGSGRSGVTLFNYPKRIVNGDFNSGFTMGLMRKDVRLAEALIQSVGVGLPVMREVGEIWSASSDTLGDDEDFNRIVQYTRTVQRSS